MYNIIIAGKPYEDYADFFTAKCRADYLYMQGHEVRIEKDGKILIKYIHMGGVYNG